MEGSRGDVAELGRGDVREVGDLGKVGELGEVEELGEVMGGIARLCEEGNLGREG